LEDELRRKINTELTGRITSERQVVYLLVEIRKLMDRLFPFNRAAPDQTRFKALRFLCNWIVHTDIDSGWAQEPLAFFERHADDLVANNLTPKALTEANSILGLGTVRDEMCEFFRDSKLDRNSLPFDATEWGAFLRHYAAVVSECSLTIKPAHAKVLKSATIIGYEKTPEEAAETPEEAAEYSKYATMIIIEWRFRMKNDVEKVMVVPLGIEKDDGFVFGRKGVELRRQQALRRQ
jgi:hypothetical protein